MKYIDGVMVHGLNVRTSGESAASNLGRLLDTAHTATTRWVTHPWARFAWLRTGDGSARLFASGQELRSTPAFAEWGCRGAGTLPVPAPLDQRCLERLARSGHLIPEDD